MNAHAIPCRLPLPKSLCFLAAAILAASLSSRAVKADPAEAPKTYTLFQGTDLSLSLKTGIAPVLDVSGDSWVVKVDGKPVVVSAKDGPLNLKLRSGLKLTEVAATVNNLKSEPQYTPANDPYTKFTKNMNKAADDSAGSQFASNYAAALTYHYDALTGSGIEPGSITSVPSTGSSSSSAQRSLADVAQIAQGANIAAGASPGLIVKTGENPDLESYDALDIAFDVSAARPLNQPYVVIICRYHERNAPAGSFRDWIYARALDPIHAEPSHIHFFAGGFTPGYQLEKFELHLYNEGNEVATNLSQKRVSLTRDEAFERLKKGYLGAHKGATLPPAPALGDLPADLSARIAQGQYSQPLFIKVSSDGVGMGAYVDPACSRKLEDPYVDSMLKDIRFEPALDGGRPVEGVATLSLDHLAM
jgi:hypothetical protein